MGFLVRTAAQFYCGKLNLILFFSLINEINEKTGIIYLPAF